MSAEIIIWIKAIHIIAVMFWVAALLILPRFYAYHASAIKGGELEQKMIDAEKRLVTIIMTPAMIVSLIFGGALIGTRADQLGHFSWLWVKFIIVFLLFAYHGIMASDRKKFLAGSVPRSEKTYRLLNEIPSFMVIIIVIMAIVEPF